MAQRSEYKLANLRPTAWACRVCGKTDWADDEKAGASPEHIPMRGIDIGKCPGVMVPLFSESSDAAHDASESSSQEHASGGCAESLPESSDP